MNTKYENTLLDYASKLDAMTNKKGKITQTALNIVQNHDEKAAVELCDFLKEVTDNDNKQIIQMASAVKDSLIRYYGYLKLTEINSEKKDKCEKEFSLNELMDELNSLVGLGNVKKKVDELIAYQKVQKLRRANGLFSQKNTMYMAFTGNPGTGKTTVARIVGRIYKQIGLLSKGQFIEVSRTDLIAGYQRQTALKVKSVIDKAKGGVLFIDEAYSITENENTDSYGRECLTELTKALEDYRDDLVVIVAGYTEPMKKFFESNPGLRSRFNNFIEFDDYDDSELFEILSEMCKKNDYELSDNAVDLIKELFKNVTQNKNDDFSNGRFVRNLFDDITMRHASRVNSISAPTYNDLILIKEIDIDTKIDFSNDSLGNR